MKRLPISCCYIVRNEEAYLKASLESVAPWIEELVFLDSGSTDRTREIAESFKANVPRFVWEETKWSDDFSAARNHCASLAQSPWLLFVDGDEILDSSAPKQIEAAVAKPDISCFSLIQRNYSQDFGLENAKSLKTLPFDDRCLLIDRSKPLYYLENWMERLYLRNSGLQYEGRVHESLLPSCERLGLKHSRLDLILHHFGRLKPKTTEKLNYYLKLTEQKWMEEKNNPVAWIELATNLIELGQFERAMNLCKDAIQKFPHQPEVLRIGFQAALRAEHFEVAETWIKAFLTLKPNDLYAQSQLTTAFLYQKKFAEVLDLSAKVFEQDPENFVTHLNCGVIYFETENWPKALHHLEAAQRKKPEDQFVADAVAKVRQRGQDN